MTTSPANISFICWEGSSTDLGAFYENICLTRNTFHTISSSIQSSDSHPWTRNGNGQYIGSYISSGCGLENSLVLTLRKHSWDNLPGKSFYAILEWLGLEGDFLVQAKILLKLLGDDALIREFKDIDDDSLLDGIVANTIQDEERVHLSNLTVRALVHVSKRMKVDLERFLETNKSYVPSIAGLTLIDVIKGNLEASLWAFSCILKVGVTRNCMIEILDIINHALPNEIRCRSKTNNEITSLKGENIYMGSLGLEYNLVSMIVESAEISAGILLHLDDSDGASYWASLNHDARLNLSLIKEKQRYPLMLEREVREWALSCLKTDIEDTSSTISTCGKAVNDIPPMVPTSWLFELISGYFDLSLFDTPLEEPTNPISPQNVTLYFDRRLQAENHYRKNINASIDAGFFDFDIIILSLLLLVQRDYSPQKGVNLQLLLDLVCDQVGRPARSLPFITDSSSLISLCGKMKNISAVSQIIGGYHGVLLRCAGILIKYTSADIDEVEAFLCHGNLYNVPSTHLYTTDKELIDCWKGRLEIMFLLEKSVLQLKKFKDLCSRGPTDGIDPVVSARLCLLSLYMLGQGFHEGTILKEWLQNRLLSNEYAKASRFASIAIIRAIFPSDEKVKQEQDFALLCGLRLGKDFLIDICRSAVL